MTFLASKIYPVISSNPAKTKNTHGHITPQQEINLVQNLHPSKAKFKFSPHWARCTVKYPGRGWDDEVSI